MFFFGVFCVFLLFCTFFKVTLWTNIAILPQTWDHISKTVFLTFFFYIKAQNCLETCVKCTWNCLTPLFTPQKLFFQKHTLPLYEMLDLLWMWHFKDIDEKIHEYFKSGAIQLTILRKVSRCLAISRNWIGNHFYMAKWNLIYLFYRSETKSQLFQSLVVGTHWIKYIKTIINYGTPEFSTPQGWTWLDN